MTKKDRRPRACIIRQRAYYELPVRREAETLLSAGFDVDVICLSEDGRAVTEKDNGVSIYRLPLVRRKGAVLRYLYDYLSFVFLAALKVSRLHHRHPYSTIQVNTMPDFLVFATIVPRLRGAKILLFMKEPTPELAMELYGSKTITMILERIEQFAIRYAHLVYTVTEELRAVYVSRGADAAKIHVVLNGPDQSHLLKLKPEKKVVRKRFTLICHGAIEERYGHDVMLRALTICREYIPDIELRILGTGSYVDQFLANMREYELEENVTYLGWVPETVMVEELNSADIGIVAQESNRYSNLVHTNKMYEYIIFDLPTILTRLDSVSNYFDESAIYYFTPGDPRSLADAILDLYHHPEKGRAMLAKAKILYEDYGWKTQSRIFLDGYQQAMDGKIGMYSAAGY